MTHIHFVGIGGIGMSGIAEILINQGFNVSGSDQSRSENTDRLQDMGAKIYIGHSATNVHNADVVVYSSAVNTETNPEILEANACKIPVIRRAEMLAEVSRLNYCIAVAGTHGKTTSTSMLALVLIAAGIDPTVIVGGRLKDLGGTNARLGHSNWTLVEADEYDRSFLQLTPTIAVINNIEPEHLDIYSDFDDLLETFAKFANMTPFYGYIAAGIDCIGVQKVLPLLRKKVITYGLSDNADYQARNIEFNGFASSCDVFEYGNYLGKLHLSVPGEFNIKNALVSVLVGRQFDIDFNLISNVISEFNGAFRRFDIKGRHRLNNVDDTEHLPLIVDDYAHHPSEIKATLSGAKKYEGKRIVAVFQPHTFTRTKEFYKDFAEALSLADVAFVTDVYPAREEPIPDISGQMIVDYAQQEKICDKTMLTYVPDKKDLYAAVTNILQEDDIVIMLGAGDIWKLANKLTDIIK
jgi:UDP-N-acetylmuramate--alanine ligase